MHRSKGQSIAAAPAPVLLPVIPNEIGAAVRGEMLAAVPMSDFFLLG